MHALMRPVFSVTAVACVVLLLSGCVPEARYYARQSDDGTISFLICDSRDARQIDVATAPSGGYDFELVWSASGQAKILRNDVITVGIAPDGMQADPPSEVDTATQNIRLTIWDSEHAFGVTFTPHTISNKWADRDGNTLDADECP